ncbi:DUF2975 domain-containing protein [Paenibacillus agilis]|nr:DUF2975 domain-containing protein [Paenibacillus agilis]
MKNKTIAKVLNLIVLIGLSLTILSLLAAPLVFTAFAKSGLSLSGAELDYVVNIVIAVIYICAIPYVAALVDLKKVCKLIATGHPFSAKIPKCLKRISIYAASEVVLFNLITIVLFFAYDVYLYAATILPCIIISIVGVSIALLSFVFSKLYEQVVEMKEELDNTI